jgi:DNA-binding NtrC family response regulator
MPLAAQAKLLTALERREVTPIGADKPEAVDVRIISATNLDEARLFDPSVFRADLLFRLNTIVMRVPPLRERREDVPLLLRHYLTLYQQQYDRPARNISAAAMDMLLRHDWPGNVRPYGMPANGGDPGAARRIRMADLVSPPPCRCLRPLRSQWWWPRLPRQAAT